MPFKIADVAQPIEQDETSLTMKVADLLSGIVRLADGGDGEIALKRITCREQDTGGWLAVGSFEMAGDAGSNHGVGSAPVRFYVGYGGASTFVGAICKLEEDYQNGSLTLYPDKFAEQSKKKTAGKGK